MNTFSSVGGDQSEGILERTALPEAGEKVCRGFLCIYLSIHSPSALLSRPPLYETEGGEGGGGIEKYKDQMYRTSRYIYRGKGG